MKRILTGTMTAFAIVLSAGSVTVSTAAATPSVALGEPTPTSRAVDLAGRKGTVEGVIRLLAADTTDHATHDHPASATDEHQFKGPSEDHYQQVLVVGNTTYFLKGKKGRPNTRVRSIGTKNGKDFQAEDIQELGAAPGGVPPSGTTNVLVMLAHWNTPDSVTQTQALSQMFSDSNGWYRDASYTALGQTGDATPWMRIAGPRPPEVGSC